MVLIYNTYPVILDKLVKGFNEKEASLTISLFSITLP